GERHADEALTPARMAVAGEPDNADFLDTLGQVLVALDEPVEAETVLRKSLAASEGPGTRVALARALAAQSRCAEAIQEASTALARHRGRWRPDEPDEIQIRAWLTE